jgi:hypothetical protein
MAKKTSSQHGKRTRNEAVAQLMAALGDSYSYRKLAKDIGKPLTSNATVRTAIEDIIILLHYKNEELYMLKIGIILNDSNLLLN